MYSQGEGVLEDEAEAKRLYRLAAEQGDALAQTNLRVTLAQRWFRCQVQGTLGNALPERSGARRLRPTPLDADPRDRPLKSRTVVPSLSHPQYGSAHHGHAHHV